MAVATQAANIRFSAGFRRSLIAVAEALFSTADGPPPAERMTFILDDVSDFMRHAGKRGRMIYRLALFAVVWVAPLIRLRRPLHMVPVQERIRRLESIEETVFGLAFFLVKTILCILYYEHPDAEAELTGGATGCLEPTA